MIIIEIVAICAFAWYVNSYVINGIDQRLIFVKAVSFILSLLIFAIIILKITSPKDINNENVMMVFNLIKDMTFLIVGFLFGKKDEKI